MKMMRKKMNGRTYSKAGFNNEVVVDDVSGEFE